MPNQNLPSPGPNPSTLLCHAARAMTHRVRHLLNVAVLMLLIAVVPMVQGTLWASSLAVTI